MMRSLALLALLLVVPPSWGCSDGWMGVGTTIGACEYLPLGMGDDESEEMIRDDR